VKNVLLVVNSEKNALAVTENVPSIEETTIPVEEMTKNEPTGFVHPVETIISLSELSAIVVENQSEVTFRNVAALSETIVADVEMTVADVTTEDLAIKNNIIEMTGFVLHVRTTTSHSELNVTNVENLDREETLEEGIPVEDVEATEEVATAADETVIVEDVEATEEVVTAADEMVTVEDVEAMTVQMNNIERLVENDQVMLTIDHLKKSSPVDINDAMTMTIKVKI
jgi:hypothetical protein